MSDDLGLFDFAGGSPVNQTVKPAIRPAQVEPQTQKAVEPKLVPKQQAKKPAPIKPRDENSESEDGQKKGKATKTKADRETEKLKKKFAKSRQKAQQRVDKDKNPQADKSHGGKKGKPKANSKSKKEKMNESSDSSVSVSGDVELVKRQPMAPPDKVSLSPNLNKQTKKLLKLARIQAREQQLQLDFDRQMTDPWFRVDDLFPLNSRFMQFLITLLCLLATALHGIVWIMRLLRSSGEDAWILFRLGLILFDFLLMGVQLKFESCLRMCFEDSALLLNRAFIAWYLIVSLQFYPFAFSGTRLYETIAAFVAMGVAGCVALVWIVQWVVMLTCIHV